ncbi:F-type H+-transporting ATPase subunit epsilon [Azospirillum fermentarium]|uniref:F0F1 ATP synthase subunit epsilon n=1 Tax=Azospirillum fermentarium TaxID=1233114 RepID=UPI0022269650|nr:F0F1 ATP synthase subunit epsilon [Azospirillum fermentarium]MCW2249119.1 F-type H+-transporting ATPase subunit epsilon [Azospirillum fermentarium]
MKLTVTTPTAIAVRRDGITHLRAEDPSGAFGILPGHADFLTALTVSVLAWRDGAGREEFCAVRGGVLTVSAGDTIAVATAEAVPGGDLAHLETEVLARFRRTESDEAGARTGAQRLHWTAVRHMLGYLRAGRPPSDHALGDGFGGGAA